MKLAPRPFVAFVLSALLGMVLYAVCFDTMEAFKSRLIYYDHRYLQDVLWKGLKAGRRSAEPPVPEKVILGKYDWLEEKDFMLIAHGLGPSYGTGGNDARTFLKGLELGFRFFEVDLAVTTDGRLVCYHGVSEKELEELDYAAFLAKTQRMGIEAIEFGDLVRLAKSHDAYFILDVKNRFEQAYQLARAALDSPELARRFIPQIYVFDQARLFEDGFFAGVIFTSYISALTTTEIIDAALRLGMPAVTLTIPRFLSLTADERERIRIFIHPVNDPGALTAYRELGVDGVYTHWLGPNILDRIM